MAAPRRKGSTTIFLAEDHVAIRELLRSQLELHPEYAVVGEATDGNQVVAQCLHLKPTLLVLDLGLPGASGLEIIRELKRAGSGTHILVFSSHHDPAVVREAIEAGAEGMVEKSAPFETLRQAIESVARGRAFFGAAITRALHQSLQRHAEPAGAGSLTPREREVLQQVAAGRSNKEVAARLGISVKTAENHRHRLMTKLQARNAADLARMAIQLGLVLPG